MTRSISRRDLLTRVVPGVAALASTSTSLASAKAGFMHGIASGDPTQDSVILWTRITPALNKPIEVHWELAKDDTFTRTLYSGSVTAHAETDFTVKVDVRGLQAANTYYYRFRAMGAISETGQTQTLPSGSIDAFKIAVCSCSNYPAGFFNAYRAMAIRNDIDLVLHLGDYIYEYNRDGYASEQAQSLNRLSMPEHEVVSLQDFRDRHAQYKSDQDLQALHARVPFILTWDDHETANDGWKNGAQNHDQNEGSWTQRKAASIKAYYEWMPIREPENRSSVEQWRSFEIGDLASIVMLETRLSARDKQVDFQNDMLYRRARFDLSDPENPVKVEDNASGDHIVEVKLPFDLSAKQPQPIADYSRIHELQKLKALPKGIAYLPDMARFKTEVLDAPGRQLLGNQQRSFIQQKLTESTESGKPWQIIGNQTLIAPVTSPNLATGMNEQEKANLADYIKPFVELTGLGAPFGTDSWNGYGAERDWFLNFNAQLGSNMLVLTGDTHAAWGLDLTIKSKPEWQAIELGTTSISSPGFTESLGLPGHRVEKMLKQANSHLQYSEVTHRGYMTLELTRDKAVACFHKISNVKSRQYEEVGMDQLEINPGQGQGVRWS